CQHSYGVPYSF
nr:immunoglobulin light chain junction region [Macaca mulatta]